MLKRILLSGAALTAFASFAVAQTPPAADPATPPSGMNAPAAPAAQAETKDPNLFSSLKGAGIVGDNDESVGKIADALVTPDGELRAVILAHGGLVGIGQTYRQYDVSALPALTEDQVKIDGLSTASLESIPEYTYPEAEGRASAQGSAPSADGTAPVDPPAMPLAESALIPVSNLIGAKVEGAPEEAAIEDLRFEGNKVSGVILNDEAKTEVPFTNLAFAGSEAEPQITMKAGGGGAAAPDSSAPAPAEDVPAAPGAAPAN